MVMELVGETPGPPVLSQEAPTPHKDIQADTQASLSWDSTS